MKKIVFVNRYFYPDHSATSQLLADLVFDLSSRGRSVEVVTSRQLYDNPAAHLPATESINKVCVRRAISTSFGRGNLLGRACDYITFYLSATIILIRTVKAGDILVAKTDPPLLSIFVFMVARLKRARFVNWVQDIFPEVAIALGVKVLPPGIDTLVLWLRNRTWRSAWRNVVAGERMRDCLSSQGVDKSRIVVVPNWADGAVIYPIDKKKNPLISAWGLGDKFVVGYSGNLGRAHDSETVIAAARQLRDEKNIVFLFIGGGAQIDNVRSVVEKEGLDNVVFMPYQPREQLAESLSLPDVHVISLLPEMEGLIVPSKFYGIAAAGRPSIFVGDSDGEIARLLKKYECGYAVPVGGAEEFTAVVRKLFADRGGCRCAGMNARRIFESCFDKPIALERWSKVINSGGE